MEGDGCGWDGLCAHHAADMAVAEPGGQELAEGVCWLERGILC